jgi:hypothetical protein
VAVSSFKDNGPGKPTNPTGLQARPWFLIHLCAIVPQILSLLRDAELSHTDMIIFSALVTNKMTPQLWVALGCLVNGSQKPMLQELGKQNPALLRLINENQAEFLRLINEAGGEGAEG